MLDIPIIDVLSQAGYEPVNPVLRDGYHVFHTPLRPSHKTSFFVYENGRWEDRGLRDMKGHFFKHSGDTIDFLLASGLAVGRRDAIRRLSSFGEGEPVCLENAFFDPNLLRGDGSDQPIPPISILSKSNSITDVGLLELLDEEGISRVMAERYLMQVRVEQGRIFRAIDYLLAFRTSIGSYLLFSEFETRFAGAAAMTFIAGHNRMECAMFTHVFDFLGLLSRGVELDSDVIIMNHSKFYREMLQLGSQYFSSRVYIRDSSESGNEINIAKEFYPGYDIHKV